MSDSWTKFTSEFERLASRKLPSRRVEAILEDLREHVDAAKSDPEFAGKSEQEIESVVVPRLGAPSDIIAAAQDSNRFAWLPVWAALIGLIWCATWMVVGSIMWTMKFIYPVLWLTPIAVLLTTLVSGRTKLWALLGTTFGVSLAMTIALAFTWLNLYSVGGMGYLPIWQVESATHEVESLIDKQNKELLALEGARAAYATENRAVARELTFVAGSGWRAPTGFSRRPDVVEYQYEPSFESAKKLWMTKSERAAGVLTSSIRRHQTNLRSYSDPEALNPTESLRDNLPSILGVSAGTFAILVLSHVLGLAIVEFPRYSRRRRWRREQESRLTST